DAVPWFGCDRRLEPPRPVERSGERDTLENTDAVVGAAAYTTGRGLGCWIHRLSVPHLPATRNTLALAGVIVVLPLTASSFVDFVGIFGGRRRTRAGAGGGCRGHHARMLRPGLSVG